MDDTNAPDGTFTHWTVYGISPTATSFPEGERPKGSREGENSFGDVGYGGPCPPEGDKAHRYVFAIYALRDAPELKRARRPTRCATRSRRTRSLAAGSSGRSGGAERRAIRLDAMDDEQLKRVAWRSVAAFQRLLGHHPEGALLDHEDFVASAVPPSNSSLINAAVPLGGAPVAPHLDEIVRFYEDIPKWGVWIDPGDTDDARALTDRGLVLDSTPVLMAAPLESVERNPDARVTRVTMDEVGVVNDAAYGIPSGTIGSALEGIQPDEVRPYGIRDETRPPPSSCSRTSTTTRS